MTQGSTRARQRLDDARNRLSHLAAQHEACIERLVKLSCKIKKQQRQVRRLERAEVAAELAAHSAPPPKEYRGEATKTEDVTDISWSEMTGANLRTEDAPGIPDFLARSKEKDAARAAEIKAEQAEKKLAKSRGRIARMKAKQSGELKRMPLTGRAALAAINQG